jgi:hypothetical protein
MSNLTLSGGRLTCLGLEMSLLGRQFADRFLKVYLHHIEPENDGDLAKISG